MKTEHIPDLLPFAGLKSKKVDGNEKFRIMLISLEKGHRLDTHTSPTDAFVYVLEGNANFNLEGRAYYLSPGDGLSFGANQEHSVNALTNFKMLLIR
jgi:quercetin dioxygenase-like cupin family protein